MPGPGKGDFVFPTWIVTQLPPGLSGLILGGVFAAAISSLDSILAALSQTTISVLYHSEQDDGEEHQRKLVRQSRMWVIIWGVFLTGFTLLMRWMKEQAGVPILPLAFQMTTYTLGPLLGMFLCALLGKGSFRGLLIGSLASVLLVMLARPDVWHLLNFAGMPYEWPALLPTFELIMEGGKPKLDPLIGFYWAWPVTTLITFGCGLLVGREKRAAEA